jgi:hypothetical protein
MAVDAPTEGGEVELVLVYAFTWLFHYHSSFLLNNKKCWEELIAYFPLMRYGPHRK